MLGEDNSAKVAEVDEKIAALEQEILQRTKTRKECEDLGQEIIRLREEKYELQLEDANKEDARRRIADLETFLDGQTEKVEEYDEAHVRRLIERITVYDEKYVVEFKSGIEVDAGI